MPFKNSISGKVIVPVTIPTSTIAPCDVFYCNHPRNKTIALANIVTALDFILEILEELYASVYILY
jgi:hypothetical protein